MKLFKKPARFTQESVQVKCPMCGTEHTTEVCAWAQHYMDGTPAVPLEKYLSRFLICKKCSYIVDALLPSGGMLEWQRKPYEEAIIKQYTDENLRKLALLRALSHSEKKGWEWVRYYQETGDTEKAKNLMNDIINDAQEDFTIVMGNSCLLHMRLGSQFFFRAKYRRIDYLRQLGRFDEARQMVIPLRDKAAQNEHYTTRDYLNEQLKLINRKDKRQQ